MYSGVRVTGVRVTLTASQGMQGRRGREILEQLLSHGCTLLPAWHPSINSGCLTALVRSSYTVYLAKPTRDNSFLPLSFSPMALLVALGIYDKYIDPW